MPQGKLKVKAKVPKSVEAKRKAKKGPAISKRGSKLVVLLIVPLMNMNGFYDLTASFVSLYKTLIILRILNNSELKIMVFTAEAC